jgi:RhtB (resistance to homoserine/threonine) family protein
MEYLPLIASAALLNLIAAISPGPDFIMAVRNSLVYSRKVGICTGVGIACGLMIHITYCAIGLGFIISKSIVLFNIIKFLGAAYLIYMGIGSIRSKKSNIVIDENERHAEIMPLQAIKIGFLTNALNPKATLFFLGLFTFVVKPGIPVWVVSILAAIMVSTAIIWFTVVAIFFSQKRIKDAFLKFERKINCVFGSLLILLGIKIALTK